MTGFFAEVVGELFTGKVSFHLFTACYLASASDFMCLSCYAVGQQMLLVSSLCLAADH